MSAHQNNVVLVNENDQVVGQMEKLKAHRLGILHRAISVFIFNDNNELLIQQRALDKYHSRGLWSNSCCSHPYPDEDVVTAGERRLIEEMGIYCSLDHMFHFTYSVELEGGLIENELDHVLIGWSNAIPDLNTDEVCSYRWISLDELNRDIEEQPEHYTFWLKHILEHYSEDFINCLAHESLQKGNI